MKKAARITLWSSMVTEILFALLLIPVGLVLVYFNGIEEYSEGILISALIVGVKALLPALFKLVIIIALLVGHKTNEKVIWPEVLAIVLFCGVLGIGNGFISAIPSIVLGSLGGMEFLATYGAMGNAQAYLSFLHSLSNSLLIMGACFGIAYKKLLLPIVKED